jgi:F0F1-type ATP synthase membrane subunit b/b'
MECNMRRLITIAWLAVFAFVFVPQGLSAHPDHAKKVLGSVASITADRLTVKDAKGDLAKAKDKIKAAEDKAADVVGDAIAQANKITADAKSEADAMKDEAKSACLAANATLGEIHAAVVEAQAKRDAAEAECAAVEAKLAKIKAQVAKVLEA